MAAQRLKNTALEACKALSSVFSEEHCRDYTAF
jgi:hypothetical protein